MKLVVFGASGGTGREIIGQALEQGHEVTALVRDPKKLAIKNNLHVIEGDALHDQSAIARTIAGRDAIICALGRANSLKSADLIAGSMAAIVPEAKKQDVRRLILISALGVGDSSKNAPFFMRSEDVV